MENLSRLLAELDAEEGRRATVRALLVARLVASAEARLPLPPPSQPGWLTVKEAGERLKKSPTWIRRAIKRKELPARKMGGEWRVPEGTVSASGAS